MSKDLTEALRAIMEAEGTEKPVPMPPRGNAGKAKSAAALYKIGKDGGGGGVASPLTESAYADRTFHPEYEIYSSDGLFSLKIKPVASMKFTDANNEIVIINLKAKT